MNRAGSASQCLHHGATVCQPDAAWVPTQNACTRAVWLPGRAIRTVLVAALLVGAFALHASAAVQHDLPHPPCGATAPFPAYPPDATAGIAPANVRAWQAETGSPHWAPPPCTGWTSDGFRTLVALAGRIQIAQDDAVEQVLSRLGAVSMLRGARYWSVRMERGGLWSPMPRRLTVPIHSIADRTSVRPSCARGETSTLSNTIAAPLVRWSTGCASARADRTTWSCKLRTSPKSGSWS